MQKRSLPLLALSVLLASFLFTGCEDDEATFPSEGSISAPVNVGAAPVSRAGTVGGSQSSYYVTSVGVGEHAVTIDNMVRDADLYLYSDSSFGSNFLLIWSVNVGTTADSASVGCLASACPLYIRVEGFVANGTSFLLTVN